MTTTGYLIVIAYFTALGLLFFLSFTGVCAFLAWLAMGAKQNFTFSRGMHIALMALFVLFAAAPFVAVNASSW